MFSNARKPERNIAEAAIQMKRRLRSQGRKAAIEPTGGSTSMLNF
jgi:hypothetical protein